jgi:predicted phosphohydrolase
MFYIATLLSEKITKLLMTQHPLKIEKKYAQILNLWNFYVYLVKIQENQILLLKKLPPISSDKQKHSKLYEIIAKKSVSEVAHPHLHQSADIAVYNGKHVLPYCFTWV